MQSLERIKKDNAIYTPPRVRTIDKIIAFDPLRAPSIAEQLLLIEALREARELLLNYEEHDTEIAELLAKWRGE